MKVYGKYICIFQRFIATFLLSDGKHIPVKSDQAPKKINQRNAIYIFDVIICTSNVQNKKKNIISHMVSTPRSPNQCHACPICVIKGVFALNTYEICLVDGALRNGRIYLPIEKWRISEKAFEVPDGYQTSSVSKFLGQHHFSVVFLLGWPLRRHELY